MLNHSKTFLVPNWAVIRPVAAAIGLALLSCGPARAANSGPVVAHWTITDLGTLGGPGSTATGINASGQVVGSSNIASGASYPFLFSQGTMSNLGALSGGYSGQAYGINAIGQITGYSSTSVSGAHAFIYENGSLRDLGTLDGVNGGGSFGLSINASGQVAGSSTAAGSGDYPVLYSAGALINLGGGGGQALGINDAGQITGNSIFGGQQRAFLYSNGFMTALPTFGNGGSSGNSINASGQVTGYTAIDGQRRAFIYTTLDPSSGFISRTDDLGSLGGGSSNGQSINSAGQVTGNSTATLGGPEQAFLYSRGAMTNLNRVNGVAGSGWVLNEGTGINDAGQVVGNGRNAAGQQHGFVMTLDTTVWEPAAGGSWDDAVNWSVGIAPNRNTVVAIDSARSITVNGPLGTVDLRQLTVGGDATGNNGIVTLNLNGGTLKVSGNGGLFTNITARGVLTGDGVLNGAVVNLGTVNAVNVTINGGLSNQGMVTGNGRLNTNLTNLVGGTVRVDGGQRLLLNGTAHSNSGNFDIHGGEIQVTGVLTNNAGGRILVNGGRLAVNSGLANSGQLLVTFGESTVFGNITNQSGGKIILSGNSNTTFYDALDVKSGGELRVSTGSAAVFFGPVQQRTGALFTGGGTKFYEGGLSVGASPGLGTDGGDVAFGGGNVYLGEIGGITACTAACATDDGLKNSSFDKYIVAGKLTFGGTLKLVSWQGFTGQVGQSFDLFDWGSAAGSFDAIDGSGLLLAAGTALDTSRLYIDGSVSVQAVPEPAAWALMLGGLMALGAATRRRSVQARHLWRFIKPQQPSGPAVSQAASAAP